MSIFLSVFSATCLMTSLHLENQNHTHIFISENNLTPIFKLDYVVPVKFASLPLIPSFFTWMPLKKTYKHTTEETVLALFPTLLTLWVKCLESLSCSTEAELWHLPEKRSTVKFFLMFSASIHSTAVLNQCPALTLRRL